MWAKTIYKTTRGMSQARDQIFFNMGRSLGTRLKEVYFGDVFQFPFGNSDAIIGYVITKVGMA